MSESRSAESFKKIQNEISESASPSPKNKRNRNRPDSKKSVKLSPRSNTAVKKILI